LVCPRSSSTDSDDGTIRVGETFAGPSSDGD
jgi:hypothetical protein